METTKVITPYFESGVFAGVRVTLGNEDFVIAPKDYKNGKEMTWQEAMDALKAERLATWNYRQICLTMAYSDEIDEMLEENGGDSIDNWYWTCAEYSAYYSFVYYGSHGKLDSNSKRHTYSVRPIKNLKK